MTVALDFSQGTSLSIPQTFVTSSSVWRIRIGYVNNGVVDDFFTIMQRASDEFIRSISIRPLSDFFGIDQARVRVQGHTYSLSSPNGQTTLSDGEYHVIDIYSDGAYLFFLIDGVIQNAGGMEYPGHPFDDWDRLQRDTTNGLVSFIEFYESSDTSNLVHRWSAADSDTSNTGQQPVLVDTVGSLNATGSGYPTDGSAWVVQSSPVPDPSITLASTPVYGETISGTYANFGGTPTGPLQADDGTRQADISITVDSNNETFAGTFPALPAAGESLPAGSLPYPGSIDVTLPDPGE